MNFFDFIERLGFDSERYGQLNILALQGVSYLGKEISVNKNETDFYNDLIIALFNDDYHIFKGTVDPGAYYRRNPVNKKGCAHVAFTQHIYVPGKHNGKYDAFRAKNEHVWILRDYNRDYVFGEGDTIQFASNTGINFHAMGSGSNVGRWSAGCIGPFGGWNGEAWKTIMDLSKKSKKNEFLITVWRGRDYLRFVLDEGSFIPTLHFGVINPWVEAIQKFFGIDNIPEVFGSREAKAIKTYQKMIGLDSDGIVGPKTWAALNVEDHFGKIKESSGLC
jgi:peptidoglycan hydrolase-like protein with peptidoglycan-binding domain